MIVEHLTVMPPGASRPLVHDLSFRLQSGDGLGVIGPTGCGKSTLARTLVGARQHAIRAGSIRFDGVPLDHWNSRTRGRYVGYMPQEPGLLPATIADNISRFEAGAESAKIVAAAKQAGIHEMILRLPDGYRSRIAENATQLSAGERQRIALARALYGDPFLVVLDEPDANLDGAGEVSLTEAIHSMRRRGGIVVVFSHRLAALEGIDTLISLSNGRLQASGRKDDVLRRMHELAPQNPRTVPPALGPAAKPFHPRHVEDRVGPAWLRLRMSTAIEPSDIANAHAGMRHALIAGAVVLALLIFGLLRWAALTEITGAVIADGTVVVESSAKKIQHPAGGTVSDLRVRNGDRIKAGDLLLRLDGAEVRARLETFAHQLAAHRLRIARLTAERDDQSSVATPDETDLPQRRSGHRSDDRQRERAFRKPPRHPRRTKGRAQTAHSSIAERDRRPRRSGSGQSRRDPSHRRGAGIARQA